MKKLSGGETATAPLNNSRPRTLTEIAMYCSNSSVGTGAAITLTTEDLKAGEAGPIKIHNSSDRR